jgi:DNA-binding GntR family transcriptional regulator
LRTPGLDPENLDRYSLRSRIFFKVRDDIISGRYQNGDVLVESKLAEEFGVSRTPVREAIRQLELEGLVRTVSNRGIVVEGISSRDVQDIYTIRGLIESLAARWAAERITPEELRQLKETVELQEFYASKNDVDQVTRLDTRFHELILNACKSKPLRHALGGFVAYAQRARVVSLNVPGRISRTLAEHRAIFEAIANKDPDNAEQAVNLHVMKAEKNLMTQLHKRSP